MVTMKDIREWADRKWASTYINNLSDGKLRTLYQNELIERARYEIEQNKGTQISIFEIITGGNNQK